MTEQGLYVGEVCARTAHPRGERVTQFVRIEPRHVRLVAREHPRLVERLRRKRASRADSQEEQERRLTVGGQLMVVLDARSMCAMSSMKSTSDSMGGREASATAPCWDELFAFMRMGKRALV